MPEKKKDIINQILSTKGDDLNLTDIDLGKLSKIALKSLQTFINIHTLDKSKPRKISKNELYEALSRQFYNQKSVHASITIFNDREDEFGGEDSGITLWSVHSKGKMTYHITDEYELDGGNNDEWSCAELGESMLENNHHVFFYFDW